jgi:hypothetical protein
VVVQLHAESITTHRGLAAVARPSFPGSSEVLSVGGLMPLSQPAMV